jgi:hypothetical protein
LLLERQLGPEGYGLEILAELAIGWDGPYGSAAVEPVDIRNQVVDRKA